MYRIAMSLLFLAASLLWSASRPDYSGTWRLDPLRSRLAKAQDTKLVLKMEHKEPAIRITVSDGKAEGQVLELTTDGAERQSTLDGQPVTVSAFWEQAGDQRLVLKIRQTKPQGEETVVREFKLGDKGRILTTVMSVQNSGAEKYAYEFFTRE